ncbi:MAG: glutathione S-transferase family protein [Spirochaetales bacterium]|nr:glutathione S-transferase family protein [Leptospiraceae bacterium]MCP5480724.1 glutathione S-transferase family protein [Spirochaetales bacterium]MCP5484076.1 glutathione S-transferase family protein [Spirochaetales bacterium]
MSEQEPGLILHHYALSPFSEKARLILAQKRLPWTSIEQPMVLPRPELERLVGGYRRIPVLQQGRHFYCDTSLIAARLEAIKASPSFLAPSPTLSRLAESYAGTALFACANALVFQPGGVRTMLKILGREQLAALQKDRAELMRESRGVQFQPRAAAASLQAWLRSLDQELAAGAFLSGKEPGLADFSVLAPLWYIRQFYSAALQLDGFANVRDWMDRLKALSESNAPRSAPPDHCLAVVMAAPEDRPVDSSAQDPAVGTRIGVQPADYGRSPSVGVLRELDDNEIVIERTDRELGALYVHFPRVGYEWEAVS